MIIKLGRVSDAGLNILDHGILGFYISMDYEDGFSQNIGNLTLDTYNEKLERRVGTAYGCEMIRQLLELFQSNSFEGFIGKDIFVIGKNKGFDFEAKGIRMLRADGGKTLLFDDILKFKE